MALDSNDKLPVGISLKEAYVLINLWLKSNIDLANASGDEYGRRSKELIKYMPHVSSITELEIRAIFGEVICGNLEWAYHKDNGYFKIAAYVLAALETEKLFWSLNEEEMEKLKSSKLWNYLNISQSPIIH